MNHTAQRNNGGVTPPLPTSGNPVPPINSKPQVCFGRTVPQVPKPLRGHVNFFGIDPPGAGRSSCTWVAAFRQTRTHVRFLPPCGAWPHRFAAVRGARARKWLVNRTFHLVISQTQRRVPPPVEPAPFLPIVPGDLFIGRAPKAREWQPCQVLYLRRSA